MISHCDPAELPQAATSDTPENHFLEAWCPACDHPVDAVCPRCRSHVEHNGASADGAELSVLSRSEFYRRFILLIQGSRNSKFAIGCYLIATGDAGAIGVSMADFARQWSVTKATVSKQCNFICSYLAILPSRYMRDEESKESYRLSNKRPDKINDNA